MPFISQLVGTLAFSSDIDTVQYSHLKATLTTVCLWFIIYAIIGVNRSPTLLPPHVLEPSQRASGTRAKPMHRCHGGSRSFEMEEPWMEEDQEPPMFPSASPSPYPFLCYPCNPNMYSSHAFSYRHSCNHTRLFGSYVNLHCSYGSARFIVQLLLRTGCEACPP